VGIWGIEDINLRGGVEFFFWGGGGE